MITQKSLNHCTGMHQTCDLNIHILKPVMQKSGFETLKIFVIIIMEIFNHFENEFDN